MGNSPTSLPAWAQWIETNWSTWETLSPGPDPTFAVGGGLLFFFLLQGHDDILKYGGTAIGTFAGYAVADGISTIISDPTYNGYFAIYMNDFTKNPAESMLWITGVGFVTVLLVQIFGGEIIDVALAAVPWLAVDSIGVELAFGLLMGLASLPTGILFFKACSFMMKLNPLYWILKIL